MYRRWTATLAIVTLTLTPVHAGAATTPPSGPTVPAPDDIGIADVECMVESVTFLAPCNREEWGADEEGDNFRILVEADGTTTYRVEDADRQISVIAYDTATGSEVGREVVVPAGATMSVTDSVLSSATLFITGSSDGDVVVAAVNTATLTTRWVRTHDRAGAFDGASGLAVTPDHSTLLVTGHDRDSDQSKDTVTLAYDASDGDRLWLTREDGSHEGGADVTVSVDGTTTYVASDTGSSTEILAYATADGTMTWRNTFDHGTSTIPRQLATAPDGSTVYLAASAAFGLGEPSAFVVAAFDAADGTERWRNPYDDAIGTTVANDLLATDDAVIAVGWRMFGDADVPVTFLTAAFNSSAVVAAFDPLTGADLWSREESTIWGGRDRFNAGAVTSDGATIVATGTSRAFMQCNQTGCLGGNAQDVFTVAYDVARGDPEWVARYEHRPYAGLNTFEEGFDVAVGRGDDRAVVAAGGKTSDALAQPDLPDRRITLAYDVDPGPL